MPTVFCPHLVDYSYVSWQLEPLSLLSSFFFDRLLTLELAEFRVIQKDLF